MELSKIIKYPVEAATFLGRQMLGGAWAELPALPQGEYSPPVRANIQYFTTPEVPDNIIVGEE